MFINYQCYIDNMTNITTLKIFSFAVVLLFIQTAFWGYLNNSENQSILDIQPELSKEESEEISQNENIKETSIKGRISKSIIEQKIDKQKEENQGPFPEEEIQESLQVDEIEPLFKEYERETQDILARL